MNLSVHSPAMGKSRADWFFGLDLTFFNLVPLFNGISAFCGLFNAKVILVEEQ